MKKSIWLPLKIILAIISGYILMVLFITLVQEVIFGGVSFTHSPAWVLLLAGTGTFLSAVAGGFVSAMIVQKRTLLPHVVMCLAVVIETSYLVNSNKTHDPLWFDILAALSLIIGIVGGGLWYFSRPNHTSEKKIIS